VETRGEEVKSFLIGRGGGVKEVRRNLEEEVQGERLSGTWFLEQYQHTRKRFQ
jgi:hypothetical protein